VVARDTAEQLGSVEAVVVDPAQHRIVALHLGAKGGRFLSWADVGTVGEDAVMATSASATRGAEGLLEERVAAGVAVKPGQRVLDDGGDEVGQLADLEFDGATGTVEHLAVEDATFASDRLRGVGSYALVIARDASDPSSTSMSATSTDTDTTRTTP
jgi:sporulation protein YlmC with PRC-barrel domain